MYLYNCKPLLQRAKCLKNFKQLAYQIWIGTDKNIENSYNDLRSEFLSEKKICTIQGHTLHHLTAMLSSLLEHTYAFVSDK